MNIKKINNIRKKYVYMYIFVFVISIICGFLIYNLTKIIFFSFGITALINLVTLLLNKKNIEKYNMSIYNLYISKILQEKFDKLEYNSKKGIDRKIIDNTKMVNTGTHFASTDFLTGEYNGIKFIQSYIVIESISSNKDDPGEIPKTIFKGHWIIINTDRPFLSNFFSFAFSNTSFLKYHHFIIFIHHIIIIILKLKQIM